MFLDIPFYRTGVYTNNDPEGYLRDDLLVVVSVTAMLQQLVVIVRCEAWFAPTLSREQTSRASAGLRVWLVYCCGVELTGSGGQVK